jgi:hypothetical protein
MQLGRKLADGYASDPEADEVDQPVAVVTTEERSEPDAVELPARV